MRRLRTGSRLGKYRLEKKLGEGGSAVVWRARDTVEHRRVALKVTQPALVDQFGRRAIEAEARVAARLDHPNVVRLLWADWIDGLFVLVSDLARASLDAYPSARRSPSIATRVLADVAEGLAHAHGQGLIHRDVKPANILVFDDRSARLGDFGTARPAPKKTGACTDAGTFGYMAPEQAYGRPRPASDVFSLALTAYELYAGELPGWPFEWPLGGNRRFSARCPEVLQPVLRRGLALDPNRRFKDGIELRDAVARALARQPEAAPRTRPPAPRLPRESADPDPFRLETRWFRKHFGKLLETHYDCHACDGPVAESMRRCPWCGTADNSFAAVTRFSLVCPRCERGVRPEWSACPSCAAGLESNGRPLPGASTADRRCPANGCGAPIHRFMRYCPSCKRKQTRPWKVVGMPPCTRCRWPVAPRWRFCAWCGKKNTEAMTVKPAGRGRR